MFERIAAGWDLAKQSYRVLWMDKELLVFPAISGVCCLAVLASFAVPLWDSSYASTVTSGDAAELSRDPFAYVILFGFYFANYFVMTFFNAAMVGCAVIRFRGDDPTLSDGFGVAFSRLPQIFAWALLAATVGTILRIIEGRSNRVGQIISGLLGMIWSVATYLVVPVLVVERVGPLAAVKRSLAVLSKTWGESLVSNFGLGLLEFGLFLLAAIPAVIGALIAPEALLVGIGISVMLMIVLALASTAARAILVAAIYEYAADGKTPPLFDEGSLSGAFSPR